jgi:hypothetical protein
MLQLQERRCAVTTHREMLSVKKLMGEQQDIGVELMKKDGNG